jgi:hypothetical protein
MKKVMQTKIVKQDSEGNIIKRGNCKAACIASILEMDIDDVPNVETLYDIDNGFHETVLNKWLNAKGYRLRVANEFKTAHIVGNWYHVKDKYYFVSGRSHNGEWTHMVIYQNGIMVHDPHPSQKGVVFEDNPAEMYYSILEPK